MNKKNWNGITLLLLLALSSLSLMDCRCSKQQFHIKSVYLDLPKSDTKTPTNIEQDNFSALIRNAIERNPYYRFAPNDDGGLVLQLSLIAPNKADDKSTLTISAVLKNEEEEKTYNSMVGLTLANGTITGEDLSSAISKCLQNLYRSMSGLSEEEKEQYRTRIRESLSNEQIDPSQLANMITILGDIEDKQSVSILIELLKKTDDLIVGNACIVALSRLGAADAMPAIIAFSERKPPLIRRQAILAAKHLTSMLSAEWLFVMAHGYDDPVVRQEALAAFDYVAQRLGLDPH